MSRAARSLVASAAVLAALAAPGCYHEPAPPQVPGPTTALPAGGPSQAPNPAAPAAKLVAERSADSRLVTFRIAFASGSADDPKGKEGLTNLVADLMTQGGTEHLTYAQLTEKLFPHAAQIQALVDRDETVFEAEIAKDSLEDFYPLFRDVIVSPRMDADGFGRIKAKETSVLVDDLRGADDEALGKEALEALVYDGHPYGHPVVGTESGLASITLEDVRAHAKEVFCRERVSVGVAGGYPAGFERRLAQEIGSGLPACDAARAELPVVKRRPGMHVLIVDKPSADATAISIGYPTDLTRAHDDYPAVRFFTDYLGLHRNSAGRLYHDLREVRGLNYGDYAYPEHFEQEGWGRFPRPNVVRREQMASIWIRPVKPKNAIFALRGALSITKSLLSEGIPKAEIDRFGAFLSRYTGLELMTESRRLGYAMDDLAYGTPKPYIDRLRAAWTALDEAKLKAAADRWLTADDVSIAIVAKDGAALAKALVAGAPTPPTYDAPKPPEVVAADKTIASYPLKLSAGDVRVVPVADAFK